MKKFKNKSEKQKQKQIRILIRVAAVLFVVLISVVLVIQRWEIDLLKAQQETASLQQLNQQIKNSVFDLKGDFVVDYETGFNYIPSQRLQFPAQKLDIVQFSGDSEMLSFRSLGNLHVASGKLDSSTTEDLFEGVPELQACSRQITLTFDKNTETSYTYIEDKQLADGRIVNIYQDTGCTSDPAPVLEFVRAVQSY